MPVSLIARPVFQRAKFVKLAEVTKPLSQSANLNLQLSLIRAILKLDKLRLYGVSHRNRLKIIGKFTQAASYEELLGKNK